jgi:hypothetical protein
MCQIVFLAGPSGVGKSHVARRLEEHFRFVHLDIDQDRGFKANGIQRVWHLFSKDGEVQPLKTALCNRIAEKGHAGAVVSFPSTRVLTIPQVRIASAAGICTVVLWGTPEQCMHGRGKRELESTRTFDPARYEKSNKRAFDMYTASEYANVRLDAFEEDGSHRACDVLIARIQDRLATNR